MIVGFRCIAEALRRARRERWLSQRELGRQLGMTQGTLSRAESGGDVCVGTLLELSLALDLEVVLVPRRLVPTIEAIVGSDEHAGSVPFAADVDEPAREDEML
jgi:transcriptional regulator with XRE-family HTH domain